MNRSHFFTKYWMLVAFATVLVAAGSVFLMSKQSGTSSPILPTLDLSGIQKSSSLTARLIGEKEGVQIHSFTQQESTVGFSAPKDKHVLYTCPTNTTAEIGVDTAHGDPTIFTTARYWGYEYSGNEESNQAAGKTGLELFDGRFWLSQGELSITGEQYGYLNTVEQDGSPMHMVAGKRYYVMVDGASAGSDAFRVSCLDSDGDGLNNGREDLNSNGEVDEGESDPNDPADPNSACGDGRITGSEACDDGNESSEDGCSASCTVEDGWECSGSPSTCEAIVPELPGDGEGNDDGGDEESPLITLIEQSIGTTDTVVENEQDVLLFRFRVSANNTEPHLNRIVLKADEGTLLYASNYTLKVDTDDDDVAETVLESEANPQNAKVTFDNLSNGGFTIPNSRSAMFEVYAKIAGSLTSNELSIGFDDNDGAPTEFSFIGAEEKFGTDLSCITVDSVAGTQEGCTEETAQIRVRSTVSKVFVLKNQGSLFVSQSAFPTPSRQLLAGQLGEAILRLELSAEDEPVDVTRLIFTNSGGLTTISNTGATSHQHVNRLKLYRDGESTSFASATIDNCSNISSDIAGGSFCAVMESQQLVVPEGESVEILVRPQMKSDEAGATQTNTGALRLMVLKVSDSVGAGVPNDTTSTGSVSARGFISSNVLSAPNGDEIGNGEVHVGTTTPGPESTIIGNKNDIVLAKITTVGNVNSAPTGSQVPIGENKTIAEFLFRATHNSNTNNGRNKASIERIILTLDAENISFYAQNFDLFNKNDQTQEMSCTAHNAQGSLIEQELSSDIKFIECLRENNPLVDMDMDSGEQMTLVLQADILNNQMDLGRLSHLQVSLTDYTTLGAAYGMQVGNSHIMWSDSLYDQVVTRFNWIDHPLASIPSTLYGTRAGGQ